MKPERKTVKCEETDIRNGKCYMLCQDEYCSVFESQTICANSHTGMRKEADDEYIARLEWMVEWLASDRDAGFGRSYCDGCKVNPCYAKNREDCIDSRIKTAEQAWEKEHE